MLWRAGEERGIRGTPEELVLGVGLGPEQGHQEQRGTRAPEDRHQGASGGDGEWLVQETAGMVQQRARHRTVKCPLSWSMSARFLVPEHN